MTRVVDIEARAMERDTYRPLFRVSEIDRRRDRKIVRMPNDGPTMTWEERLAASEAKLAKLIKPRLHDSMVTVHTLYPLLRCIKAGIVTQKTIAAETKLGIGTIAARCSEANRKGLILSRRDRALNNAAYYSLTQDGERFLASFRAPKPIDHERKAEGKAMPYAPPSPLRNEIMAYLCSGDWRTAAQIAKAIGKTSNHVSAAARRGADYGLIETRGAIGTGSIASYRITDAGREYLKTGVL